MFKVNDFRTDKLHASFDQQFCITAGYFCNNSTSADTKENDQHAGKKVVSSFAGEHKSSLRDHHNDINNTANAECRTTKRALPSSLAESLRAVFAAFLWHEGTNCSIFERTVPHQFWFFVQRYCS